MPSPQHESIVALMKSQPALTVTPNPTELREGFEMMAAAFPLPDGVETVATDAGGVAAEWVTMPDSTSERVVLYLHGGGYGIGSIATHRSMTARLAAAARARVLSVDYRLAPEHPFPAAVDDALAAYRFTLASGVAPDRLVVAGDSAGGGLTLALLLSLRDAGEPLPAAAVCISPWADLEGLGASANDPSIDDPMIQAEPLREMGRRYAGATDPKHPLVSPVHADYAGMPPMFLLVGTREALYNDTTRVAEKARAVGVDVEVEIGDGLIHVWPFFGDEVPEAAESMQRIGEYIRSRVP